ncbi:MAG: hypothetical protein AAF709_10570, partial [Pseudomonadota bacterium]
FLGGSLKTLLRIAKDWRGGARLPARISPYSTELYRQFSWASAELQRPVQSWEAKRVLMSSNVYCDAIVANAPRKSWGS